MASDDPTSTTPANGADEPLFEPGLKKKSKKKFVDFDLEGDVADEGVNGSGQAADSANANDGAAGEENADDLFGGLKKKSKKKKSIPMDLVSSSSSSSSDAYGVLR